MDITARFLTRAASITGNYDAVVVIEENSRTERSIARCVACGWTRDHGDAYRRQVVEWAQEHADQCTAVPS
ncbi:hypothetical protein GTY41_03670 [Streptomyces sp. SID685]|uniref:hypothetical protein n=1 Tax=Streptomyces sp. SID685 TaxID=2690322 RepID=UPI0013679E8F|nr:hypothetical protein [Streptomyces sp. SID685]MYR84064.1 hypothetical protein [Streptomyces sp. SID685]